MNNYYPTIGIGKLILKEFSNTQIMSDMVLKTRYDEYRESCLNLGIDPFSFDRWLMEIYNQRTYNEKM